MKILQGLIVLFAIVGCLALALGGFFVYNMSQTGGDNFLSRLRTARATQANTGQTTAPVAAAKDSEFASIINQYQPTPTPAPLVAVQQPGAAPGAAPVMVAAGAAAPAVKPVKTPKPDEGRINKWPTGKKWVALTYDDGPHQEWTPKMIELLKSKNVKATFFLLGQEIMRFPELAKSIADNGFEVGNHTLNHPDFSKAIMSTEKIREQLSETNKLIAEHATQQPVRVMRPPYGSSPNKLEPVLLELNLQNVCWSIDTEEWKKGVESKQMVDNIMKNLSDGSIILMHDRYQKTYDTTVEVIDKIRAEGYEFVTMSEMLGLVPYSGSPGPTPQAAAAAAPITAAPAAQPASTMPAPPAAADNAALPVPAAALAASPQPAVDGIDSSKITVPPPQR